MDQKIDKDQYQKSLDTLYEIFKSISDTTNEVSQWRCPYKNAKSRCTALFSCRNQHFTKVPDDLPVCAGSDKLDYRGAWETHSPVEVRKQLLAELGKDTDADIAVPAPKEETNS
ncbi:MAG: hypothetical protein FJ319_07190 [SAR202 cluster bacterium]|nr:hypothetical protein [SAR202 cluster bacterium]